MKADSGNMPKIDVIMIAHYFKYNSNFYSAELKNVKTFRASRESYGGDAIGYVQLRRDNDICIMKCKITPEHKINSKSYSVTLVINELNEEIVNCECHDCTASQGGCKHAVAFLMWAHRRSEEPATTSTECYWRKSTLSKVGTSLKFITAKKLSKQIVPQFESDSSLFTEFLQEAKKRKLDNCQLLKYQSDFKFHNANKLSLHILMLEYNKEIIKSADNFLLHISGKITNKAIKGVELITRGQHKSSMWYELRYARITASKAYEVTKCHTGEGSLVMGIMGAKIPDTKAMRRGRILEDVVKTVAERKLGKKFTHCGLFLSKECPVIAASPDGISEDAVIEIKCPISDKAFQKYIKNGKICDRYAAQVQLQMFVTKLKKCYFCVANSNFEQNSNIEIVLVPYDEEYVNDIIGTSLSFWKKYIYPLLYRSTTTS